MQAPGSPGHVRAQQIGYHDILPARLEGNLDAFGPKYESLNETLKTFNQKILRGEEEIPGSQLCSIFCFILVIILTYELLWKPRRVTFLHKFDSQISDICKGIHVFPQKGKSVPANLKSVSQT